MLACAIEIHDAEIVSPKKKKTTMRTDCVLQRATAAAFSDDEILIPRPNIVFSVVIFAGFEFASVTFACSRTTSVPHDDIPHIRSSCDDGERGADSILCGNCTVAVANSSSHRLPSVLNANAHWSTMGHTR